jgi:hypothetical protein
MNIKTVIFNIEKETAWPKYHRAMAECGLSDEALQFVWKEIAASKAGRLDVHTRMHPDFALPSSALDINFRKSQDGKPKAGDIVVGWQYNETFSPGMVSMKIYQF